MKNLLVRKSLKPLPRRLRLTAAALLALLLWTTTPTTPASAAAGDLDPSFGSGGRVTTDFGGFEAAYAVAVQADGKLVVTGGGGQDIAGQVFGDFYVVRYRSDGSLDTGFGSGGKVLTDFGNTSDLASAVAVQADGKIVVVGFSSSLRPFPDPSHADFALARYNADGTPDSSFGTDGKVKTVLSTENNSAAGAVAVQADGRLVVAGIVETHSINGEIFSDFAVVRYNADGTLDSTFGTGGVVTLDFDQSDGAAGLVLQPDGRIVLAGSAWKIAGGLGLPAACAVARLNTNGTPDAAFDGDGKETITFLGVDECSAVAIQPDGRLIVAGSASTGRNLDEPDFALARLNSNGTLDQTFGERGRVLVDFDSGSDNPVGVAVAPGGRILAGGYTFRRNGFDGPFLAAARFNPDGSPDNTFGAGGRVKTGFPGGARVLARGFAAQPDGKPVIVGEVQISQNSQDNTMNIAVARYDAAVGAEPASFVRFSSAGYGAAEGCAAAVVTVAREGDLSAPASVEYKTRDGSAQQRSDYTHVTGTLSFAAGESSKTFNVPVNDDAFAEGSETIRVELTSASPNVNFRTPAAATLTIADDDTVEGKTNPLDESQRFVCQHYHDFLSRQPDAEGLAFWTQGIETCGADAQCREVKRVDVSTAFFLSIEFQQTGYFVIRAHKAAFGPAKSNPRYADFLRDTQRVARGVVVGAPGADALLEANKQAFAVALVTRPEFLAQFPESMTFDEYIGKLAVNSGVTLTPTEINILFEGWSNTADGRARTLRRVIELGSVYNRQFNAGFVLSQYFGYLRRGPADNPDFSFEGYDFWLAKLDSFSLPGEDVRDERVALARIRRAEMVKAFVTSLEYRQRFGQP
ncbi:MAG: Calx-beta domain-containing protein [Pyrinomonadaceae bacterium]